MKYQKAALLQKFNPLITLWQFAFDLLIFKLRFTTLQYIGFGILALAYVVQLLKYVLYDAKKAQDKKKKKDDKELRKDIIIKNAIYNAK